MELGEAIFWGTGGLFVTAMWIRPSPHFSWTEATVTTRTVDGGNQPDTWEHRLNIVLTCNLLLERVRSLCGGSPVDVTSFYRSAALQRELYEDGTSSTDVSDHELGLAADIFIPGFGDHEDIARVIYANRSALPVKQCIVEHHTGHLHLAMDIAHAFDPKNAKHDYRETFTGKGGDYPKWTP